MPKPLQSIAELSAFTRRADKLLSSHEQLELISYLAEYPTAGDIMEDTGGVRKLRWGYGGQGKRGGARIVYYYHDELMPLYLLTLFAKNEKANLTKAERNELADLVDALVSIWKRKAS